MRQVGIISIGVALGIGAALGLRSASGAADVDAYAQLNLFSDAFQRVRADYVHPVGDDELVSAAIEGMVSNLDPHSSYMDARSYNGEFQITTTGQFGGVGITVVQQDGAIEVVSPSDGMPAAKAGIKPGDRIVAINGVSVLGEDFNSAIDKMRGPIDTKVTLTIVRSGEKRPFDVTLTRAIVSVDAATSRRVGNIGYIRLPSFNEQTAQGLERAVRDLKKQIGPAIKGYVLDLRNNPGGLLDQAVQVSDDFLESGEIVSTRGRLKEDTQRFDATPGDITEGKPIIVLINAGTASASEIVSGALQDHRRATIVGMTSFGKGSVQSVIPLGEGRGALRLTTARYFTPSGHSIQAQGIIPDIEVAQGDELSVPMIERFSEADLKGHLAGDPLTFKPGDPPVTYAAPGMKYDDFQLAYAIDLLNGKMTVYSVTKSSNG